MLLPSACGKCCSVVTAKRGLKVALWVLRVLQSTTARQMRSGGDGEKGGCDEGAECSAGSEGAADC